MGAFTGGASRGRRICGFPDYLGSGADLGSDGNRRTRTFIVPFEVTLAELRWRPEPDAPEESILLPQESVVCVP